MINIVLPVIAPEYRKTKAEMDVVIDNVDNITVETLLMIDYAYHNTDKNYEDGLSFLDRLHWKLSMYFPINWQPQNLKDIVRNSASPAITFVQLLNAILTPAMIDCYGV